MLIYSHPDCIRHETPDGHPERSDRLRYLLRHLSDTGFTQDHPVAEASPIEAAQIDRAHHPDLLKRLVASGSESGLAPLDPDTWMGPSSMSAALQAAGLADVLAGEGPEPEDAEGVEVGAAVDGGPGHELGSGVGRTFEHETRRGPCREDVGPGEAHVDGVHQPQRERNKLEDHLQHDPDHGPSPQDCVDCHPEHG